MYDIKAIEFGQCATTTTTSTTTATTTTTSSSANNFKQTNPTTTTTVSVAHGSTNNNNTNNNNNNNISNTTTIGHAYAPHLTNTYSTCSIISHGKLHDLCHSNNNNSNNININHNHTHTNNHNNNNNNSNKSRNPADSTHMTLLSLRRRRLIQRHACLLSILAAFVFGLALGVIMPMFGLPNGLFNTVTLPGHPAALSSLPILQMPETASPSNDSRQSIVRPPSDFPTIYAAQVPTEQPYTVAFIKDHNPPMELSSSQILRNAFQVQPGGESPQTLHIKRLDDGLGGVREFVAQRTAKGRFRKGPERQTGELSFVPLAQRIAAQAHNSRQRGIIRDDIYWGELVESALPRGFGARDTKDWNRYVTSQGVVERLEPGCGRMQNRMVVFADGTRACARYRQNTDQIQGELFSFYLGQLLNLSNLAPSAASVVDLDGRTWSGAMADITQAQWKQQRPVVLTSWLPELEPAGIPQPFQPLERHLNKYDVWNITLAAETQPSDAQKQQGLLKRLSPAGTAAAHADRHHQSSTQSEDERNATTVGASSPVLQRLIELAQWSDLIVFDYLIANLDRVVNNLYNFQWNADMMAAPAHNLARQMNSQLLVFLDNESGLLHGYRLLKKYEAYHGLLLDNLCVFRRPTIEALRQLRDYGAGRKLREMFEETTSNALRDVLPPLPDKSIKILVDRIDHVLGQVQKCKELLADR